MASPAGGAQALPTVALGDSVPRGTNCHCTPYPQLIADQLSKTSGETVTAANDSVAGYTTANVLRQVTSDRSVIQHLRSAGAIEIEIGANDVPYTSACGTTVSCYAARVPVMKTRLTAIVRRIRAVTSRHRADVVLLDYWSIWLGGEYAAAKGPKYVAAAEEMTARVNAAIRSVAARTGSGYVDVRAAFKGPSYTYDETHYLSSDGDHPNAAGHERIAQATASTIKRALHL